MKLVILRTSSLVQTSVPRLWSPLTSSNPPGTVEAHEAAATEQKLYAPWDRHYLLGRTGEDAPEYALRRGRRRRTMVGGHPRGEESVHVRWKSVRCHDKKKPARLRKTRLGQRDGD